MTDTRNNRVCPLEVADSLDSRIRRWVQNPGKILSPYVKEGMNCLDLGCGPGFMTIDMALLAGETGRVTAADLQLGMLDRIRKKIAGTEFEKRIRLHLTESDSTGLDEEFDFILLFYMVHEVPDQAALFNELHALLSPNGKFLLIEPPFHVSKKAFQKTLDTAGQAGFTIASRPKTLFDKAALLIKS